jgi:hypothetical protein
LFNLIYLTTSAVPLELLKIRIMVTKIQTKTTTIVYPLEATRWSGLFDAINLTTSARRLLDQFINISVNPVLLKACDLQKDPNTKLNENPINGDPKRRSSKGDEFVYYI